MSCSQNPHCKFGAKCTKIKTTGCRYSHKKRDIPCRYGDICYKSKDNKCDFFHVGRSDVKKSQKYTYTTTMVYFFNILSILETLEITNYFQRYRRDTVKLGGDENYTCTYDIDYNIQHRVVWITEKKFDWVTNTYAHVKRALVIGGFTDENKPIKGFSEDVILSFDNKNRCRKHLRYIRCNKDYDAGFVFERLCLQELMFHVEDICQLFNDNAQFMVCSIDYNLNEKYIEGDVDIPGECKDFHENLDKCIDHMSHEILSSLKRPVKDFVKDKIVLIPELGDVCCDYLL